MSRSEDPQDDSPTKTKLTESADQSLGSQWCITYVLFPGLHHVRPPQVSHHDGKVILAPTKGNQSMVNSLTKWMLVPTQRTKQKVSVLLGFPCVRKVSQSKQGPVSKSKPSHRTIQTDHQTIKVPIHQ